MNANIKKACLILAATACASLAQAQNMSSGYFIDNNDYRFELNPAFGNEHYFAGGFFGNLNVGLRGNLNLSDIIYNVNGKTCLFTNPGVSAEEFMSNIENKNKLNANIKENIISAGFKAFGGYNTVSVNANIDLNMMLPRELFSLAKEGVTNKTYDITNLRATASSYAEVALNHSHDIKAVPGLRVGATAKFLVGIGKVDAYFNKAQLSLQDDRWSAVTNADVYTSIANFRYLKDRNENTGHEYVSDIDIDKFGINGMGFAVDLGASYKFKDWEFSAAVLDLGFIHWKETYHASTNGDQTISTDAYTFNVDGDAQNNFDDEIDRFGDDLSALYELNDNGNIGGRSTSLAATMNVGVKYTLPVYDKLNFGLLNTTRFGSYAWTEFRLSANVMPIRGVALGVNGVTGTYGTGFGWLLSLGNKGPKFHVGMDRMFLKLAKQGVPLNSNIQVNFGIDFAF
jgi:hypothetical protein